MTTYSVHSRDGAPIDQAIFVPERFSAGAFAFTLFWALWHRMWLVAAVLFALWATLSVLDRTYGFGEGLTALAGFTVSLLFGFEAQNLRATALKHAGYRAIGFAHGRNLDEAELRFYLDRDKRQVRDEISPAPRFAPAADAPDALGIFGNV